MAGAALAKASIKEPFGQSRKQGRPARQGGFIEHHAGRMNAFAGVPVGPFGRDTQEEHRPRDLFQDVAEIFGPHDRPVHFVPHALAKQLGRGRRAQGDRARIARIT